MTVSLTLTYSDGDRQGSAKCCCLQCAKKWTKTSNSCPQCRKEPLEIVVDPKQNAESLRLHCTAPIIILGATGLVGLVR